MSKYKLVEVMRCNDWVKRNAIHFNNDGSVWVVNDTTIQLDDTFNAHDTSFFCQYRENQQPTWKPFPDNESMEHLKDCWFRLKNSEVFVKGTHYNPMDGQCVFMIGGEWWSKEDLFEKAEVLTNGKWQPVGVEEC